LEDAPVQTPQLQPEQDASLIGHISDVTGSRMIATLRHDDQGYAGTVRLGMEELTVGQLGSNVAIRTKNGTVLAQVVRMWEEEKEVRVGLGDNAKTPSRRTLGFRRLELLPLGEITKDDRFVRGVSRFPTTGAEVHLVTAKHLESLFDRYRSQGLDVGRLSNRPELRVYLDANNLFGRHFAIVGQSGAGKSWTVASLLQRAVKNMPDSHIILLDLHGEYGWRDAQGNMHSAFPTETVRHLDARELEIPYWLLTFGELVDLLIDRTEPNASVQIAFLREAVFALRKKANLDLGLDRLSVDSPVFFSIKELYLQFKKANEQQLEFGKAKGPLNGMFDEFLVRFQSMFNDSRYDFLFRPRKRSESQHLEDLLRDFVGLGEPRRQITVIDLSPIPADVRPLVSAQVGRLAFEFNYWNPRRREFPLLLVCEEAHQYISRDRDPHYAGTRKAMERIAKEGRKYGVGLGVVSQRPTELSETVLAQCSNFICLRTTNPDDQDYVRQLMPEGEQDLADVLASLRRGEALVVGEAAPLPTRFQIYAPEPPPASHDAPLTDSWREGPADLDVKDIVNRWWRQER
jgi:DNA helicase HerA-like ATPase